MEIEKTFQPPFICLKDDISSSFTCQREVRGLACQMLMHLQSYIIIIIIIIAVTTVITFIEHILCNKHCAEISQHCAMMMDIYPQSLRSIEPQWPSSFSYAMLLSSVNKDFKKVVIRAHPDYFSPSPKYVT